MDAGYECVQKVRWANLSDWFTTMHILQCIYRYRNDILIFYQSTHHQQSQQSVSLMLSNKILCEEDKQNKMDEIQKLEYLSLVSKICTELDNHYGLNDKDLGQNIIYTITVHSLTYKKIGCQCGVRIYYDVVDNTYKHSNLTGLENCLAETCAFNLKNVRSPNFSIILLYNLSCKSYLMGNQKKHEEPKNILS